MTIKVRSHLKNKVGTLAERGLIRRIDWCLLGKLRVKLGHVIITRLKSKIRYNQLPSRMFSSFKNIHIIRLYE